MTFTDQRGMMKWQRGPAYSDYRTAYDHGCDLSDREQTPVGLWARDGWHVVSDVAPDIDEDDTREADGWHLLTIITPDTEAMAS